VPAGNYANNTNAGAATASFTYTGDANHTGNTGNGGFTIDPAGSTVTISCGGPYTYTGSALTPCTYGVKGNEAGSPVLVAAGTAVPAGNYANNTNAGAATASFTYLGDANHSGNTGNGGFTIDPAGSTVTITCGGPYTYTGSALTPCTYGVKGNEAGNPVLVAAGTAVPAGSYANNTNAGAATASFTYTGDANHTGNTGNGGFTIDPAGSTVTISCGGPYTYTGSALTPCTYGVKGNETGNPVLVAAGTAVPAGNYANNTNAGAATASFTYLGDANHSGNTGNGGFTINPANQTIIFNPLANDYIGNGSRLVSATGGGSGNAVTFTATGACTSGGTNGATISYTGLGLCTVTAHQLGNTNYNAAPDVGRSFTILIDPTLVTLDLSGHSFIDFDCIKDVIKVTVKDTITNLPISGASVTLAIGSQSIVVVTNGSGVGTGIIILNQAIGSTNATASYAGDGVLHAPASDSKPVTITGDPNVGPGLNATSLYTGSLFFWTTGPSSSTATLTLSATVKDTGVCPGDINKAKVSFYISTGGAFSPVSSAQNLPVGYVDPADHTVGAASAISQYNIGNEDSVTLTVRVVVSGEYTYNYSTYDIPITIGKAGVPNSLTGGGQLNNDGNPFTASGYLGTKSVNSKFGSQVVYNKKGTNPQGQVTVTIRSCNKVDGSTDPNCVVGNPNTHHVYWVKSNSISELSLISGSASFGSKTNGYELLADGTKVNFDSGNSMQVVFTPQGAIIPRDMTTNNNTTTVCTNAGGCASIVLFRSAGGVWYSSSWGQGPGTTAPHTYEKNVVSGSVAVGGTLTVVTQTMQTRESLLASNEAISVSAPAVPTTLGMFAVPYLNSDVREPVASAAVKTGSATAQPTERSLTVGSARMENKGANGSSLADGLLGKNWVSSLFENSVGYIKAGVNAEGRVSITVHSCNLPDGSLDRRCFAAKSATHHVYLIETSSLTEPTLDLGITSFGSRINVYELLAGGRKTSLDSTGLMQIVFVAKGQMIPVNTGAGGGALCTDERGCAALVAQKADGGIWFSGTWFLTERKGIETPAIR
jgi:hypothetical protein